MSLGALQTEAVLRYCEVKQNLKFAIVPTKSFCLEDFDEFGTFANRRCTTVLRGEAKSQNRKIIKQKTNQKVSRRLLRW